MLERILFLLADVIMRALSAQVARLERRGRDDRLGSYQRFTARVWEKRGLTTRK